MNAQEAVAILRSHNEWRRGNRTESWHDPMPYSPAELGHAIDVVCDYIGPMTLKDENALHAKPCWCDECHKAMLAAAQQQKESKP